MEGSLEAALPPFPRSLYYQHRAAQEVPGLVVAKLRYQYEVITSMAMRDINLCHDVCRAFMTFCLFEGISLPAWIKSRFCDNCFSILIPSVTSHGRLVHRSKHSHANMRRKPKMTSELLISCGYCKKHVVKEAAFVREPRVVVEAPAALITAPPVASSAKKPVGVAKVTFAPPKTFSFLDRASGTPKAGAAKAGNPKAGVHKSLPVDARRKSAPAKLGDDLGGDFVPLAPASLSCLLGAKRPVENAPGPPNLLELERLNKKKRRQSLGGAAMPR